MKSTKQSRTTNFTNSYDAGSATAISPQIMSWYGRYPDKPFLFLNGFRRGKHLRRFHRRQ